MEYGTLPGIEKRVSRVCQGTMMLGPGELDRPRPWALGAAVLLGGLLYPLIGVAVAVCGLVVAAGRRKGLPDDWRRARHAWAFTLFGISVAAATVHLWNALFVLFLFLLGSGAWLTDGRPGAPASKAKPLRNPVPRVRAQARLF